MLVPSLGSFLLPSSGNFCCTEDTTSGGCTSGDISLVQSRGAGSPPSYFWLHFFWCSPGHSWLSGLWGHIAGLCPVCHQPVPPNLFQQGYAQSFCLLTYIDSGGCLDPGARPCMWLCQTSGDWPGPTVWSCLDLFGWHPTLSLSLVNCTTQLDIICKVAEGALDPTVDGCWTTDFHAYVQVIITFLILPK